MFDFIKRKKNISPDGEGATVKKVATSRSEMTKGQWLWKEMKRNKVAYIMVAPFMLIFSLFTVVPVLLSIVISFTNFNLLEMPEFVGFSNYFTLFFEDDIFITAVKNTFIFAIIVGPVSYLLSFMAVEVFTYTLDISHLLDI